MARRLTLKFVEKCFKDGGCVLLETKYINSYTKIRYICNCGNISEISFSNFKQGRRCAKCGDKRRSKSKTHTLEFVKQCFLDRGCKLLEAEYINNSTPMRYECNCKNISEICFNNFQQGQRCKKCSGCEKHTFKYVEQCFLDGGCILLEKKYINAHTKMRYECNCGDVNEICFDKFQIGQRCKKCRIEQNKESQKNTFEFVFNCFKDERCELLETEYINNRTKMKYICSCGNIDEISFNDFQIGGRCHLCGIEKRSGKNHYKYNPNLTDEERLIGRNYPEYSIWRTDTYKRDDYTCQKCFIRGGDLNAHHVEDYAGNKKLRLDEKNGITLCKCCHVEFHKKYGYGNNTRQQLNEFLGIVLSCN